MIKRPVFIIGSIRSGTTILYNLVAAHRDLCWFTQTSDAHPGATWPAARLRWLNAPWIGRRQRQAIVDNRPNPLTMRLLPWPSEGDRTYHEYCGFGQKPDGLETDLTPQMESRLREVIELHLRASGRPRFLSKQTANNRRLDLIDRMFPDAVYVHIIRDGRAVSHSMLREPWWPDTHVWWLGRKASEWAPDFRDAAELAAVYWKRTIETIRDFGARTPERYLELRYRDLVRQPREELKRIHDFAELRWQDDYARLLPAKLNGSNEAWKARFSEEQQAFIHESIGKYLAELDYDV
jgi:hypothetical protein